APADAEPADPVGLKIAGNEIRCGAAENQRDLLFVVWGRDDDSRLQLEVADQLLLERDATREFRVERDADEAVSPRIDEDAVDPQPRGAETARNVGLGQSFHEIEPGGSDLHLLRVDHQLVSSTGG